MTAEKASACEHFVFVNGRYISKLKKTVFCSLQELRIRSKTSK